MNFPFTKKLHSESIIVKELFYRNSLVERQNSLSCWGKIES